MNSLSANTIHNLNTLIFKPRRSLARWLVDRVKNWARDIITPQESSLSIPTWVKTNIFNLESADIGQTSDLSLADIDFADTEVDFSPLVFGQPPPVPQAASGRSFIRHGVRIDPAVDLDKDPSARVGYYKILEKIGQGGFGAVYRAFNTQTKQEVALKTFILDGKIGELSFQAEVAAAEAMQDGGENLVRYLEAGGDFVVMELLDGRSLRDIVLERRGKALTQDWLIASLKITREVLVGLGSLHNNGLIHADVTPNNVFVAGDPLTNHFKVRIFDPSLGKFIELADKPDIVAGSQRYMPPEQAGGSKSIDNQADVFSAGLVFYSILTGLVPFQNIQEHRLFPNISKEAEITLRRKEGEVFGFGQPGPYLDLGQIDNSNGLHDDIFGFLAMMTAAAKNERYASAEVAFRAVDTLLNRAQAPS